jgi:hypothetical protein
MIASVSKDEGSSRGAAVSKYGVDLMLRDGGFAASSA